MASSKKYERTCRCGKTYTYCPHCDEYKTMETWHLVYCSENCKDIDFILSNWGSGVIDSKKAAAQLKTKDTSRMSFWNDNFQAAYNQIMGEADSEKHVEQHKEVAPKVEQNIASVEGPDSTRVQDQGRIKEIKSPLKKSSSKIQTKPKGHVAPQTKED